MSLVWVRERSKALPPRPVHLTWTDLVDGGGQILTMCVERLWMDDVRVAANPHVNLCEACIVAGRSYVYSRWEAGMDP